MNILIINGSPRGAGSNSLKLAKAFCEGMRRESDKIFEIDVSKLNINSCLGCFGCWSKTPGKCCIDDDMAGVIEKNLWADVIVWSFPLYYYTVPGKLKILIDRQLPMVLPTMVDRADSYGSGAHPARYDMHSKRHVVISTCGFWSAEGNYDGVDSLFSHMCGKDSFEKIYCGEGEIFRSKSAAPLTEKYLKTVEEAGKEYINGGISPATREKLNTPLLPKDEFEKAANNHW